MRTIARAGRDALSAARLRPWAEPGTFYSPLSTADDAARALAWRDIDAADIAGIDLREADQLELATALADPWPTVTGNSRYRAGNSQYAEADASVLVAMLRQFQPRRVIEIGSGWSTAAMLDAGTTAALTCIDPYPERLLSALRPGDLDRLDLLRRPVQDVAIDRFAELEHNDVLLIDSTHVVKPGSDVIWEYLHILPRLKPGVLVHVHDIFWPFEYPEDWLRERRDWTELYLLRALLTGSSAWGIEFFSNWLWTVHPELVPPTLREDFPSSIWIRKLS